MKNTRPKMFASNSLALPPTLEPGLGLKLAGECLVTGSVLTGPSWAQSKLATLAHHPQEDPRGCRCNVVWVAIVARGLDDPIKQGVLSLNHKCLGICICDININIFRFKVNQDGQRTPMASSKS